MNLRIIVSLFCLALISQTVTGQVTTKKIDGFKVLSSKAVLLGKSKSIRESVAKPSTSKIKKKNSKIEKKAPQNFSGRKNQSKAVHMEKEHQGPDPVRQSTVSRMMGNEIEILANVQGRGQGSPIDPTGDVDSRFYVQAVNATQVGVYNLDGSLEMGFSMNTLWTQFGANSAGDPIILFDENADRWFLTEFAGPSNVLIAVSQTNDPLGEYFAYSFATPAFPDYPKYAITPDYLTITTNEGGSNVLDHYFLDKNAMIAGEEEVSFQEVELEGTNGSEQGFYVATPVDYNGTRAPFDSRPISVRLNDSSWAGGPDQDQIELYQFNVDFDNPSNTSVEQTSIVTAPFDAFPCSVSGGGFQCIPQLNGGGLDGVPEIIMNIPHQRNFGSHESIVLSHITDATDGNNVAGVRWVELRRTADTDWSVYQQGTYAPDDGLQRFMSSVAIDEKGAICLGYNVSSENDFAGLRATGRNSSDPLGMMTYDELIIREGQGPTTGGAGRFGDYSQMSVAPEGKSEFWFTTEYGGPNGTISNIVGMSLQRDSFDLALSRFITPLTASAELGATESVTVEVVNSGINAMPNYNVGLLLEGIQVDLLNISDPLAPNESREHTFTSTVDFSEIRDYDLTAFVSADTDTNPFNDSLRIVISKLPGLEGGIVGSFENNGCEQTANGTVTLTNMGGDIFTDAIIGFTVNGVSQEDIEYKGSLSFEQSREFAVTIDQDLMVGDNDISFNIFSINGQSNDFDASNNTFNTTINIADDSQFVTISLFTDDFPAESAYTLVDQTTGEVYADSDNFTEDFTLENEQVCVAEGTCMIFTMTDGYGDGICCNYGMGSITILDNQGLPLVASSGDFGSELVIEFCNIPGQCLLTAEVEATLSSTDTSNDGTIMITPANGVGPFEYSVDGGTSFQTANVFNNLPAGDYNVLVVDGSTECTYEETITVDFISTSTYIVGNTSVNVDLIPNPTDGIFKISVANLPTAENFLDIQIFDIQGKLLQERKIGKFNDEYIGTFSLFAYPAGTYLVKIQSEDNNFLERIVKQ